MKEKQSIKNDDLSSSLTNLGVGIMATTGIMSMMLGGMNKMFSNNSEIPKGVVKEMMQGVIEGIMQEIKDRDYEIDELKEKVLKLTQEHDEAVNQKDKAENKYIELSVCVEQLREELSKLSKKPTTKKKKSKKKTTRRKPSKGVKLGTYKK